MELFNNSNPYYEKWKPGRPSKAAIAKRKMYWLYENVIPKPPQSKAKRIAWMNSILANQQSIKI
jgi:hypothetical protein